MSNNNFGLSSIFGAIDDFNKKNNILSFFMSDTKSPPPQVTPPKQTKVVNSSKPPAYLVEAAKASVSPNLYSKPSPLFSPKNPQKLSSTLQDPQAIRSNKNGTVGYMPSAPATLAPKVQGTAFSPKPVYGNTNDVRAVRSNKDGTVGIDPSIIEKAPFKIPEKPAFTPVNAPIPKPIGMNQEAYNTMTHQVKQFREKRAEFKGVDGVPDEFKIGMTEGDRNYQIQNQADQEIKNRFGKDTIGRVLTGTYDVASGVRDIILPFTSENGIDAKIRETRKMYPNNPTYALLAGTGQQMISTSLRSIDGISEIKNSLIGSLPEKGPGITQERVEDTIGYLPKKGTEIITPVVKQGIKDLGYTLNQEENDNIDKIVQNGLSFGLGKIVSKAAKKTFPIKNITDFSSIQDGAPL